MASSNNPPRRRLELALFIVIFGVLAWFFLGSVERTQRDVEEARVRGEIASLRVDILDRLAHRETFGGALPAGSNPVDWAGRAPENYLGARASAADVSSSEAGNWYYDRASAALTYRFRAGDAWQLRLQRERLGSSALAGVSILCRFGEAAAESPCR